MLNNTTKNNFRIDIPDNNATSSFIWQVQSAQIPAVSMETARISRGPKLASNMIEGTGTTFEDLRVTFLVDENLDAYAELLSWLLTMNNPIGPSTPDESNTPRTVLLHFLDNSRKGILATFRFMGCYPRELSEVEFTYTEAGEVEAITCDVMFAYSHFEMSRKVNGEEVIIKPRTTDT